jgi:hypothetical protein
VGAARVSVTTASAGKFRLIGPVSGGMAVTGWRTAGTSIGSDESPSFVFTDFLGFAGGAPHANLAICQ